MQCVVRWKAALPAFSRAWWNVWAASSRGREELLRGILCAVSYFCHSEVMFQHGRHPARGLGEMITSHVESGGEGASVEG